MTATSHPDWVHVEPGAGSLTERELNAHYTDLESRERAAWEAVSEHVDALMEIVAENGLWRAYGGNGDEIRRLIDVAARQRGLIHDDESPVYRKKRVTPGLRMQVFERDGYRCRKCGSQTTLRADHVIPEREGGPTVLENLQTLCAPCNSSNGTRSNEEFGL